MDQDQELVALGVANLAAGVTQGFAVSASASRTPVAEAAGARTQLTGLVGAVTIALMLVAAPGLTANLPSSCLAAIVIVACLGIVDLPAVVRMARLRPTEAGVSMLCFLGVAVLGVVPGIDRLGRCGAHRLRVAGMASLPRRARPGRGCQGLPRRDALSGCAADRPGAVPRWDAPLFFANAGMFREHVLEAVAASPEPARWVSVAAEPVTDIDLTAADMLQGLLDELNDAGVTLVWGELKDPVKDRLRQYGLFELDRRRPLLPHHGLRRRRIPQGHWCRVDGLGGARVGTDREGSGGGLTRTAPGTRWCPGPARPCCRGGDPGRAERRGRYPSSARRRTSAISALRAEGVVERHVGERVGGPVVRPRLVDRGPSAERAQASRRLGEEALQLGVLDPPAAVQLLHDELRIETQVDLLGAQPLGLAQRQHEPRVLGDVVRPDAEVRVPRPRPPSRPARRHPALRRR